MTETPTHVVERMVGLRVTLLLKDTRQLAGKLDGVDEHLNLVLDDVDEATAESSRHLGKVVLRGSSVLTLHSPQGATGKPA